MAVDIQRVVMAALEAAVSDNSSKLKKKKKGLSTAQAVAVGAALLTVGRVAAKPGGRYVKNKLRERLADATIATSTRTTRSTTKRSTRKRRTTTRRR